MNYTISQAQLGTRPNVQIPNPKILEHLGEDGMIKMVSDHYDILKNSTVKGLFPPTEEGIEMAKSMPLIFHPNLWRA